MAVHMRNIQRIIISLIVLLIASTVVLHNPFGGYEREQVLYTKSEFLKHLREAFPEYSDISDNELYKRLLEKYPNFKTWILEETDGSEVKPISITNLPTNYRLNPPPAYYGKSAILRSKNSFIAWLDEPLEFIGFIVLIGAVGTVLFLLFRKKSKDAE
jgi:hypothetical protein